jgi:hypothetical protein
MCGESGLAPTSAALTCAIGACFFAKKVHLLLPVSCLAVVAFSHAVGEKGVPQNNAMSSKWGGTETTGSSVRRLAQEELSRQPR